MRSKKLFVVHNHITNFIDFFYSPFKKWMPLQTFRYAFCGSANTVLGFLLYTFSLRFLFPGTVFNMGFYSFKSHNAALFFSFLINLPVGFMLMKYVVFVDSTIRGHVQLVRYCFVFISNLVLNYYLLKLMIEYGGMNAIVSQVISTAIVIFISYLLQRHFTFKTVDGRVE